jgi:hypothetical protein
LFKDAKKELERLEAELLAEEPEEEYEEDSLLDDEDDFGEEIPEVYRNFSNRYSAYNTDRADWDPEELGEELDAPKRSGIWGLCALILALTAGIFLLLALWVFKLKGGVL